MVIAALRIRYRDGGETLIRTGEGGKSRKVGPGHYLF